MGDPMTEILDEKESTARQVAVTIALDRVLIREFNKDARLMVDKWNCFLGHTAEGVVYAMLADWFKQNDIPKHFYRYVVDHGSLSDQTGDFRVRVLFGFEKLEHALLFKLTWGGK